VERIELPIPHLSQDLDGLCIAQISDIHLGPNMQPGYLCTVVQRINAFAPQYVLITGDYVSKSAQYAEGLVEPLRQLQAPAYAIWGNHDHSHGLGPVQRAFEETPVQILRNQAVPLRGNVWLAGLDDMIWGRPDLKGTLRNIPNGAVTLLMVHEPDYFGRVLAADVPVAIQFSGHSHGGQIRLPSLLPDATGRRSWAPILPDYGKRYPIGLYEAGNKRLYTNRGLGFSGPPLRLNCGPEITLFTLRAGL
jgi:predicted MPP superfamily phosphohydrolase